MCCGKLRRASRCQQSKQQQRRFRSQDEENVIFEATKSWMVEQLFKSGKRWRPLAQKKQIWHTTSRDPSSANYKRRSDGLSQWRAKRKQLMQNLIGKKTSLLLFCFPSKQASKHPNSHHLPPCKRQPASLTLQFNSFGGSQKNLQWRAKKLAFHQAKLLYDKLQLAFSQQQPFSYAKQPPFFQPLKKSAWPFLVLTPLRIDSN